MTKIQKKKQVKREVRSAAERRQAFLLATTTPLIVVHSPGLEAMLGKKGA